MPQCDLGNGSTEVRERELSSSSVPARTTTTSLAVFRAESGRTHSEGAILPSLSVFTSIGSSSGDPIPDLATRLSKTTKHERKVLLDRMRAASTGPLRLPEFEGRLPPGHPLIDMTGGDEYCSSARETSACGTGGNRGKSQSSHDLGPDYPFGDLRADSSGQGLDQDAVQLTARNSNGASEGGGAYERGNRSRDRNGTSGEQGEDIYLQKIVL